MLLLRDVWIELRYDFIKVFARVMLQLSNLLKLQLPINNTVTQQDLSLSPFSPHEGG